MFNPKNTDVDEHFDLINTLGDMVDQKEEAKMEKFIETMPTMIQTHLIICKDWAAMPLVTTGATVLGANSFFSTYTRCFLPVFLFQSLRWFGEWL